MSTSSPNEATQVCITDFGSVDILGANDRHKYLGRLFTGDFSDDETLRCPQRFGRDLTIRIHLIGWIVHHFKINIK